MLRLRFPSATSLAPLSSVVALGAVGALAALVALGAGCSDDSCGPGGAPAAGLVASGDSVTLTYGQLTSGVNNDCPASNPPAGVISVTINGTQSDGTGVITLCVSRPDLLTERAQTLGPDAAGSEVRVVDLRGSSSTCSFTVDRTMPITGNATSSGLCGNGSDPAGFALSLDGALSLTRTCGQTVDSIQVALRGRVAVARQP